MDNQNQQPTSTDQTANPQPEVPHPQTAAAANPQVKPEINMSSEEVQALLSVKGLLVAQQPKTKPPIKLLFAAIGLIVFAIVISVLIGAFKPGTASKSSGTGSGIGLPNQSIPTSGSDVTNQINQDEKSCSNLVNATTTC